ncbi:hypothetical protein NC651_039883 [Populus alba x Populus x berolinensis]|nr:hypothetical protein NC651_039883 [Populus alba x Populus x berolinensis]
MVLATWSVMEREKQLSILYQKTRSGNPFSSKATREQRLQRKMMIYNGFFSSNLAQERVSLRNTESIDRTFKGVAEHFSKVVFELVQGGHDVSHVDDNCDDDGCHEANLKGNINEEIEIKRDIILKAYLDIFFFAQLCGLEYHVSSIPLVILFLFAYHVPSLRVHLDWGNESWVSSKKRPLLGKRGRGLAIMCLKSDFLIQNLDMGTPYTNPISILKLILLEYHVTGIPLVILFLLAYQRFKFEGSLGVSAAFIREKREGLGYYVLEKRILRDWNIRYRFKSISGFFFVAQLCVVFYFKEYHVTGIPLDFLIENFDNATPYTKPISIRKLIVLFKSISGFFFVAQLCGLEYHVTGIPLVILFLFAYHVSSSRIHLDWGNGSWVSSKKRVNLLNCCID